MPPPTTTMDSLKDDNVEEILLRLPSWASLGHAVRASDRFRRIASSSAFLRRFRARHAASSSRCFLGVFAQRGSLGLPVFELADAARSDPGLIAVARTGDFLLAGLEDDRHWDTHDCRNGRLLLSRGRSLTVYDPISLRRTDISLPKDDPFSSSAARCCCLLDDGDASFCVVSLQTTDDCQRLRAVEYDSKLHEWRNHPWAADAITPPWDYRTTYAAGLVFLDDGESTIMLDTLTMEFSMLPLPATITSSYAMGETEDGNGCLVCVSKRRLQVWLLRENRGGRSKWVFEKEKPLRELFAGHYCDQHRVEKVVAGLVIVWAGSVDAIERALYNKFHHYAIDLKKLCVKAKLYGAVGNVVYPFQLPWPHPLA